MSDALDSIERQIPDGWVLGLCRPAESLTGNPIPFVIDPEGRKHWDRPPEMPPQLWYMLLQWWAWVMDAPEKRFVKLE